MPDTLARTMLARAAARLNAQSGHVHLPSLIFLTDDVRTPDPLIAIAALPRGALVILRARNSLRRSALAHEASRIARANGLLLSVAGDVALAREIGASIHLSQAEIAQAAEIRARQDNRLLTAAAHDRQAVEQAQQMGVDAALLSPIFETRSHAGLGGIGIEELRSIARATHLPLYALGGVDQNNVAQLSDIPLAGIAAIGALLPD